MTKISESCKWKYKTMLQLVEEICSLRYSFYMELSRNLGTDLKPKSNPVLFRSLRNT